MRWSSKMLIITIRIADIALSVTEPLEEAVKTWMTLKYNISLPTHPNMHET